MQVLIVFLVGSIAWGQSSSPGGQGVSLDDGWEFLQAEKTAAAEWRPAQVPGDVHLDLLRNKLIPDLFYRENEVGLQWIENANWEYRKTFSVSQAELTHRHIEMVFHGLDRALKVMSLVDAFDANTKTEQAGAQ